MNNEKKLWTRQFIFVALINFTTFIGFNMTTTGMPVYMSSLGANDFVAGLVTTFAAGAALLVRPFSGMMLDRFGRKSILISSTIAMALILAAYAVFPIMGIILALRLAHGIAWGLSSTAVSTMAADSIPKSRFAEGMGYFALATALAVAIAPALSIAILENWGIKLMIIVATSTTIISVILAILQHYEKMPKREKKRKIGWSDLFDKRAMLPAATVFLITCAFASVTTFIALHGQAQGIKNIFLYFTVYAVTTIVTRPIIGKIIDKVGFFMPGILSTIGVVITLVIIAFSSTLLMLCVAGVFAGLGLGTGMGTLQTMAVSAVPPERRGVATSTYLFGFDAGIASGAAFAGAMAKAFGYSNMFLIMAIFPAIACGIFLIVGRKRIASYAIKE